MKEAASPETLRVAPLEDRPLSILEEVLDDANHFRSREASRKHLADRIAALDGIFRNLMVDGIGGVECGQSFDVGAIKGVYPSSHDVSRAHSLVTFLQRWRPLGGDSAGRPRTELSTRSALFNVARTRISFSRTHESHSLEPAFFHSREKLYRDRIAGTRADHRIDAAFGAHRGLVALVIKTNKYVASEERTVRLGNPIDNL